jgi:hypothetical protein
MLCPFGTSDCRQKRIIFKQYIPKNNKCFGIKIYKLCDMSVYTYDMVIYLQNDRICATGDMTMTRVIVRHFIRKVERHGHKLYTVLTIIFSLSGLFDNLTKMKLNCCRTVTPNRNAMPQDLLPWCNQLKF